jgi:hypothetical protein
MPSAGSRPPVRRRGSAKGSRPARPAAAFAGRRGTAGRPGQALPVQNRKTGWKQRIAHPQPGIGLCRTAGRVAVRALRSAARQRRPLARKRRGRWLSCRSGLSGASGRATIAWRARPAAARRPRHRVHLPAGEADDAGQVADGRSRGRLWRGCGPEIADALPRARQARCAARARCWPSAGGRRWSRQSQAGTPSSASGVGDRSRRAGRPGTNTWRGRVKRGLSTAGGTSRSRTGGHGILRRPVSRCLRTVAGTGSGSGNAASDGRGTCRHPRPWLLHSLLSRVRRRRHRRALPGAAGPRGRPSQRAARRPGRPALDGRYRAPPRRS